MPKYKKHPKYPLYQEEIKGNSGYSRNWHSLLPVLKGKNFYKQKIEVGGDAPKSFIRAYEYGECRKDRPSQWTAYIAKVGHKWYPIESITEYLMNRIGEGLGLKMAKSKLVIANNQIRFLSRYFLKPNEQLVHGAQIYAGYLEDEDFVNAANERKEHEVSRELFTFQFTESAIKGLFPDHHETILDDFVAMLVFDAIVGNNDRHFYNWGIVTHLIDDKSPTFSPVYDTARGLFWNTRENALAAFQEKEKLLRYVEGSQPRTGWENAKQINHFELVQKIFHEDGRYCKVCQNFLNEGTFHKIECLINAEFQKLMSKSRLELIKKCLKFRIEILLETIC